MTEDTTGSDYTERLAAAHGSWWKRLLDVQAPYRRNLLRKQPGRTLDVGCGIGRNLATLGEGSVGIDHNPHSVRMARQRGLAAFTPEEFRNSDHTGTRFDSLLFAHVLEHMTYGEAVSLIADYLRFLRPGGQVIVITPQEAGFRSDPTHVDPFGLPEIRRALAAVTFVPISEESFPLPRAAGRWFRHNENVVTARRKPDSAR